jgi:hypothetical protein
MQLSRKDGSNLSPLEISEIRKTQFHLPDLMITLKHTTLRKSFNYLTAQREKQSKHFISKYQVLTTWRDYIADCITLGMDLKEEQVLFPRNLYTAHQNTITQIKVKDDEALTKKIKARMKELGKYRFTCHDLTIRAARDTKELIAEGKSLHHCVGTYAARYAKGETDILVIRKVSEPDKPYYTVEIRKGEIVQARGKNNCLADQYVAVFIKAFTDQKLNTKNSKGRARIAVPV